MASCLDPVVAVSVPAPGVLFTQVYSLHGLRALHVYDVCVAGKVMLASYGWIAALRHQVIPGRLLKAEIELKCSW